MACKEPASVAVPEHLLSKCPCGHTISDVPHGIWHVASALKLPDVTIRSGKKRFVKKMDLYCQRIADHCLRNDHGHEPSEMAAVALTLLQISQDNVMQPLLVARAEMFKDSWRKLVNSRSCAFGLLSGLLLAHSMARHIRHEPGCHDVLYSRLRDFAHEFLTVDGNCVHTMLCVKALGLSIPLCEPGTDCRAVINGVVGLFGLPAKMSGATFAQFFITVTMAVGSRVPIDDDTSVPVLRFLVAAACASDALTRRHALSTLMRMPAIGAENAYPPPWDAATFLSRYYTQAVLSALGQDKSELQGDCHKLVKAIEDAAAAMREFHETRDAVHLGLRLCELIRDDPFSVTFEPGCSGRFGFAHNHCPREFGFPFDEWSDTLSHAANALAGLCPTDLVSLPVSQVLIPAGQAVEILRLQHAMEYADWDSASETARVAKARFPDELFFIYAASTSVTMDELDDAVRAVDLFRERTAGAIWGNATYQMLVSSCAHGAFLHAVDHNVGPGTAGWDTVARMLGLAHALSGNYIAKTTPTSRDAVSMRAIQFLSACLIFRDVRHPRVRLNMPWADMVKHWESLKATAVGLFEDLRVDRGILQAAELCLKHGPMADTIWGSNLRLKTGAREDWSEEKLLEAFRAGDPDIYAERWTPDDLRVWNELNEVRDHQHRLEWDTIPVPILWTVMVPRHCRSHLHHCTGCGEQSSLLRKCGACREARYCSEDCQRKDWKEKHRGECSGAFRDSEQ